MKGFKQVLLDAWATPIGGFPIISSHVQVEESEMGTQGKEKADF